MSFILDALKKSESDRQRQNGPALFEVKVAPPRTRLPAWAIAIAALLVVNLGIVMWLLMRHPARAGATDGAPATAVAPAASPGAASAAGTPAAAAEAAHAAPPPTALARAAAGAPALSPAAVPSSEGGEPPTAPGAAAPSLPPTPGAADGANPDDYAPAQEGAPSQAPAGPFSGRVRRGTASGVPLYQDAAATPGTQIPQLRLDLHVFALRPQDRFVMINMHKVHEGDTTPEGVHVDNITPEGTVLSYNGSRFLLPRE